MLGVMESLFEIDAIDGHERRLAYTSDEVPNRQREPHRVIRRGLSRHRLDALADALDEMGAALGELHRLQGCP